MRGCTLYLNNLILANKVSTPGRVLYVDDREKNVKPGQELGIQGYVFSNFEAFTLLLNSNGILGDT